MILKSASYATTFVSYSIIISRIFHCFAFKLRKKVGVASDEWCHSRHLLNLLPVSNLLKLEHSMVNDHLNNKERVMLFKST